MALRTPSSSRLSIQADHTELPKICLVTADREFYAELLPELRPWFELSVCETYVDLARLTRETKTGIVLIDVDTEGDDPHGGLGGVNELRRLNGRMVLVSLSRSRTRSLEKRSLEAGADAHFRSPVDLSEVRLTLVDALQVRKQEHTRRVQQQRAMENSRFQDFIGSSEPMRMVYEVIQQVADSNINVLVRGESGTGKELVARALVALFPPFILSPSCTRTNSTRPETTECRFMVFAGR